MKKKYLPFLITGIILIIDQVSKIWIKTHMQIGEEIYVFNWFRIHFLENEGMAFGFSFGGDGGKLLLSILRIVAIGFIIYYLGKLVKKGASTSLLVSFSLILAGAMGNMIDCAFYGLIFNDSYFQVAQLFPPGGGYASFLHGKVVDMLYFPLFQGVYPQWIPFVGGESFLFFRPVFNVADSAISIGFIYFFITQKDLWWPSKPKEEAEVN